MSTYGYAVEQIGNAVQVLATTDSDLRSRLKEATVYVRFAPPTDLPPEMAESLRELQSEIENLVGVGSSADLGRYADSLVALNNKMHREQYRHDKEATQI